MLAQVAEGKRRVVVELEDLGLVRRRERRALGRKRPTRRLVRMKVQVRVQVRERMRERARVQVRVQVRVDEWGERRALATQRLARPL